MCLSWSLCRVLPQDRRDTANDAMTMRNRITKEGVVKCIQGPGCHRWLGPAWQQASVTRLPWSPQRFESAIYRKTGVREGAGDAIRSRISARDFSIFFGRQPFQYGFSSVNNEIPAARVIERANECVKVVITVLIINADARFDGDRE